MNKFWYINKDFYKERSKRIGASDIPCLIPNPELPHETLASYTKDGKRIIRTPLMLWEEKTGRRKRDEAGLPAQIGHFLENKILEIFLSLIVGEKESLEIIKKKIWYEMNREKLKTIDFQHENFKHNVQIYRDGMIAHPDMIYIPTENHIKDIPCYAEGIKIDLTKPFGIEAKSASFFSARRPKESLVKGYDVTLKSWKGIPLSHYMQIQYQMLLFDTDVTYLPLISNTNKFNIWEIKANKKHQDKILEIVQRMVWHIENDETPKEMIMNANDINLLYPIKKKDNMTLISGPERDQAIEIAKKYNQAKYQKKRWEQIEKECKDSMGIILKDNNEIRDSEQLIAKWMHRSGYEKVTKLSDIKKHDLTTYRYLKRKGYIKKTESSQTVDICYKFEDD